MEKKVRTHFSTLGIKVIVTDDGDIEAIRESFLYGSKTFYFNSQRKGMLESKMHKFILAGTSKIKWSVSIYPRSQNEVLLFLEWFDHHIWIKRDGK
jgi:hypothetical protein